MGDKAKLREGRNSKTVAVVVPLYRDCLTRDEEVSLRHLRHFLGSYDKYLVVPEKLRFTLEGFGVKRFRDEFFHDPVTYSALLLSREFYETFAEYKYILIYQFDALVFSDQLLEWCATNLDYVGAPWFRGEGVDFVEQAAVGNGGFSLRKVDTFLRVLNAPGCLEEREKYWDAFNSARPAYIRLLNLPRKIVRRLRLLGRSGKRHASRDPGGRLNEDCFWSFRAVKYYPEFKIASVPDALRFSFEINPRQCYQLNNRQLPFGCHAWDKYDRDFWRPLLLK